MGIFTWTFANRKIKKTKYGDPCRNCKLPYDGYGCVLLPNGEVIEETCYNGYGEFAGKDVYELVVDWNREHLMEIMEQLGIQTGIWYTLAKKAMESDDTAASHMEQLIKEGKALDYLKTEWKRTLGIEIACGEKNKLLPFPIKIVSTKRPRLPYDKLPASEDCQ